MDIKEDACNLKNSFEMKYRELSKNMEDEFSIMYTDIDTYVTMKSRLSDLLKIFHTLYNLQWKTK